MRKKLTSYFGAFHKEDFLSWRRFYHSAFFNWFLFIVFTLAISFLMNVVVDSLPTQVVGGSIAPDDIWADRDYQILEAEATNAIRQEARQTILPQFVYNKGVSTNLKDKISKVFADWWIGDQHG